MSTKQTERPDATARVIALLVEVMRREGITINQLAERLGFASGETIRHKLRGKFSNIRLSVLDEYFDGLGYRLAFWAEKKVGTGFVEPSITLSPLEQAGEIATRAIDAWKQARRANMQDVNDRMIAAGLGKQAANQLRHCGKDSGASIGQLERVIGALDYTLHIYAVKEADE